MSPDEAFATFIDTFAEHPHRERYHALLETDKGREKLLRRLDQLVLDERACRKIALEAQTPEKLAKLLCDYGAPQTGTVYLIRRCEIEECELLEALAWVLQSGVFQLVLCPSGKLAFFQQEWAKDNQIIWTGFRDHMKSSAKRKQ